MRKIVFSRGSERKLRRFIKRHPELKTRADRVINLLRENPVNQSVGAHKLSGRLRLYWAADVTFHYRIVYSFDDETLYLLNIGTHDETYE